MDELDDLLDPGIQNDNNNNTGSGQVPNAGGILALGIISIATCWLYGVPGLVCGIIAIVLHKKAKSVYLTNPAKYEASYKNAKAGMICGVIGLCLSALFFVYIIIVLAVVFSNAPF